MSIEPETKHVSAWHELRFEKTKVCKLNDDQIRQIIHDELEADDLINVIFDDFLNTFDWAEQDNLDPTLCRASAKLPGVVLILTSESEDDSKDIWCNYYCDGKYHYAAGFQTFEPYDPEKLKACEAQA